MLTAGGKYSLLSRDSLMQQIQMHSSQKQKNCSQFFRAFLNAASNFERFQKKDDLQTLCISEIRDSERRC